MSTNASKATASDNRLTNGGSALPVSPVYRNPFCPECGQPLPGRVSGLARERASYPWWAWVLIAVGVVLAGDYGLKAGQAARELAATRRILQALPAWDTRLEGPSAQHAALRAQGPPGVEDRYLAAQHDLNRALPSAEFGLALAILGGGVLARWSARQAKLGSLAATDIVNFSAPLASIQIAVARGWALAETVALSACCLIGVGYLYLLGARLIAGEAPTLDVFREAFERIIFIVGNLLQLVS